MGRTPLLRSLRRLAQEWRVADATGLSLDAVREVKAEAAHRLATSGIPRRTVLGGAAAVAAGLSLPRRAQGQTGPRIAVIGAGIAGLTAAMTLKDAGYDCTIYESSGRVGGRMFSSTSYWADRQVSEWGGELIDTGHKTVLALARRYKLKVVDLLGAEPNSSEPAFHFFGQYYPKRQADIDFQPVHNALQGDVQAASYPTTYLINTAHGRALDNMSIYDWIESRVPGGHGSPMGMLLDVAYNIEFGAETTDQSSLNLVYLLGYNASPGNFTLFGGSDERYHIDGGNQQLPSAIAKDVGGQIQTGMRLEALRMNAGGSYTMTFNDRGASREVTADYVVLTVPFAVLRNLSYGQAGFDALKHTAIQEQGTGRNGKLHLQFRSRYWNGPGAWPGINNGEALSDVGFQNVWDVTRGQSGASGILVDYTGGQTTLAMRTRVPWASGADNTQLAFDAERFLAQVEQVLPGATATWNGRVQHSLPHLDPNLNCSYSYWKVGQYTHFAGHEGARQGNVLFAGEHTSVDFQGWMEGGASSGIAAANALLADLK
jgi:monoamine oxidase